MSLPITQCLEQKYSTPLSKQRATFTSGGEVISDLPITMQGVFGKGKLRGKLNGCGLLLTLRTSAGDIKLRSR